MNDAPHELITARQLGEQLKVSTITVRRWARAGLIPSITLPRIGVRFDYAAVLAALREGTGKAVDRD
jgi:excisionase family DNA binding protein